MEEEKDKKDFERDEIFSRAVRAGKRTYFFDVKSTRKEELYVTITESKKRISPDGKPIFEKHKIFLYREDFQKFIEGFKEVVAYVDVHSPELEPYERNEENKEESPSSNSNFSDVKFEDLDK